MVKSMKDAFDRACRNLINESTKEKEKTHAFSEQFRQGHASPSNISVIRDSTASSPKANPVAFASVPPLQPLRESKPLPRAPHSITVSKGATFAISLLDQKAVPLLAKVESIGRTTQCHTGKTDDEREVVLGLDFGTSSVKVVMGDSALGKAFAVPFCEAEGVGKFLLPSRLCQRGSVFSLEMGNLTHLDLKLSLLANPEDRTLQVRVVAFLALVIRRARGWLFAEQSAAYRKTRIVWKLAVGLPAAQHLETELSRLFERLSLAAWTVAGTATDLSETLISSALDEINDAHRNNDDVEITVVPEIAAQIYGFVASNSFDKKAANIYLMADVGAGTVDSSLFHVKPGKGGRWDFEFYTSVVEPLGVSNLHRHRVNWWTDELTKAQAPRHLLDDLAACKLVTDQQLPKPESFLDYFKGVQAKFEHDVKTPDEIFFDQRVLVQVQVETLWRTWKNNLLTKASLTNIPFFMCGGGMRMKYYQALESGLASMPGCSWLKAECRVMGVPGDLIADTLAEDEYDRLSVAYGLSRLDVGKIVKALPQPRLDIPPVETWRDNYIDKDQC